MIPNTRPLGDNFSAVNLETKKGGSTSSFVDQSTNKHLPYIWFNGVLSALSIGFALCAIILYYTFSNRVNVSENHWRNDEVEIMNLKAEVKRLQEDSHARN